MLPVMLKGILMVLLAAGPLQAGRSVRPEMTVLESEQREGYTCQLVEYNVSRDERVRSYLLVPDGAGKSDRRPGLVLLHDHGARFDIGKEKLVRPLQSAPEHVRKSAKQWVDDGFDGVWFADRLAAAGYVVIVPDALYWGSRSTPLCQEWSRRKFGTAPGDPDELKTAVYEGQRTVYDSLARKGVIWAEQTMREDAAAARLLCSLPCVQKRKIGCFGWSMGAHRAWLLTAFCRQVRTGVALCWMTLMETQVQPYKASDYSMLIPQMREKYDFPDIARWLAPKPFFFLNGLQDKLFPVAAVETAFARMQAIYQKKGAAGMLRTEFFDGSHHCGLAEQQAIINYLDRQLK